jgi:hypothetical protein
MKKHILAITKIMTSNPLLSGENKFDYDSDDAYHYACRVEQDMILDRYCLENSIKKDELLEAWKQLAENY